MFSSNTLKTGNGGNEGVVTPFIDDSTAITYAIATARDEPAMFTAVASDVVETIADPRLADHLITELARPTDRRTVVTKLAGAGVLAAIGLRLARRDASAWSFNARTYTSPICCRCYPVTQWTETGSHRTGENRYAIDIGTPSGTPVYATKSGTVVRAGWEDSAGGVVVRVNHNDQLQSVFAHLSRVNVRVGQWVNKDYSLLGWSGATGAVSGPHLHWALKDQYSSTGVNMATIPGVSYRQICP